MTITATANANEILNIVAAEVGLVPISDPFGSVDDNFVQMQVLLNTSIRELTRKYDWEFLQQQFQILTAPLDDGIYDLPSDFLRMINQTGWERSNRNPINALSPQQWAYLEGRNLVSETIWVNFRVKDGKFNIYPNPVSFVYDIHFEYISNLSVIGSINSALIDRVQQGSDVPLFDELLLSRMVKVKWYEAKGFDSTKAQDDLNQIYADLTAVDASAPILNAGHQVNGLKLLNSFYNTSDTNYGNP